MQSVLVLEELVSGVGLVHPYPTEMCVAAILLPWHPRDMVWKLLISMP